MPSTDVKHEFKPFSRSLPLISARNSRLRCCPSLNYQSLATENQVSRKFLHHQSIKAKKALAESLNQAPQTMKSSCSYRLQNPQLILGLVLICHSSYRGSLNYFAICLICLSASGRSITACNALQPKSMTQDFLR